MHARKTVGILTGAFALVASGAILVALPGCGGDDAATIEQEKPLQEELKGSMEYMQQQYSKKGKSRG
ncbi:hypothetical protein [Paludisphaera sp.]|uniref:hypothetical protein n=1 Tax=Paludisphaera sp. TaxID=2017432 RepID=UPI00301DC941